MSIYDMHKKVQEAIEQFGADNAQIAKDAFMAGVREAEKRARTKIRRLENMIYDRDTALVKKYRITISRDQVGEAMRRCCFQMPPEQCGRLATHLEAVMNGEADAALKELRDVADKIMCPACEGKGCIECDLTGIPDAKKFRGGSGKRVIRKTGGLT